MVINCSYVVMISYVFQKKKSKKKRNQFSSIKSSFNFRRLKSLGSNLITEFYIRKIHIK